MVMVWCSNNGGGGVASVGSVRLGEGVWSKNPKVSHRGSIFTNNMQGVLNLDCGESIEVG